MSSNILDTESWAFESIDGEHLLETWFAHLSTTLRHYEEPILNEDSVLIMKQMCDFLEQTPAVFVLSVDVIEAYLRFKNSINQPIEDPLLTVATIIFISHKFVGASEVLLVKSILELLRDLTVKPYYHKDIILMEVTILSTVTLPLTTIFDDLDIIVVKCTNELGLRADLHPLCVRILEFLYMNRSIWFQDLKHIFQETYNSLRAFRHLISSKLCLPLCIFIIALKLLKYEEFINIDASLINIIKLSTIPSVDNLQIIIQKLIEIIQK